MIVLLIFFLLLLSLFGYLFFAPFYLEVNSISGMLRVRFHRLAMAQLFVRESSLILGVKIAGWHRDIVIGMPVKKSKPEKRKPKKKAGKIPFRRIANVMMSFKVNRCYISIDTSNQPVNGVLFPLFLWLGRQTGASININFWGDEEIVLEIENNVARMTWAFFNR